MTDAGMCRQAGCHHWPILLPNRCSFSHGEVFEHTGSMKRGIIAAGMSTSCLAPDAGMSTSGLGPEAAADNAGGSGEALAADGADSSASRRVFVGGCSDALAAAAGLSVAETWPPSPPPARRRSSALATRCRPDGDCIRYSSIRFRQVCVCTLDCRDPSRSNWQPRQPSV